MFRALNIVWGTFVAMLLGVFDAEQSTAAILE